MGTESDRPRTTRGAGLTPSNPLPQMEPAAALWRGTVTALMLVLPAGLLNLWLVSGDSDGSRTALAMLFWVIILLGAGAGGWATIRLCEVAPISYAAASAAIAYGLVQGGGIIHRLIRDKPISWLAFPFLMMLMATCGMLGGMLARRWLSQQHAES